MSKLIIKDGNGNIRSIDEISFFKVVGDSMIKVQFFKKPGYLSYSDRVGLIESTPANPINIELQ